MRILKEGIRDPLVFDLLIGIDRAPIICPRAHDNDVSQPWLAGVGATGPQLDDERGIRAHPQPRVDRRVAQSIPWSPKSAMKRIFHTVTAMVQIILPDNQDEGLIQKSDRPIGHCTPQYRQSGRALQGVPLGDVFK